MHPWIKNSLVIIAVVVGLLALAWLCLAPRVEHKIGTTPIAQVWPKTPST